MYEEGGGFIHRRLNIFEEFFHKPKCRPDRCSNMNIFLPKRKNNNLLINTGTKYFPEFYQLMRMGEVDPCLAGGSCGRCECAGCAKVCKGVPIESSPFSIYALWGRPQEWICSLFAMQKMKLEMLQNIFCSFKLGIGRVLCFACGCYVLLLHNWLCAIVLCAEWISVCVWKE